MRRSNSRPPASKKLAPKPAITELEPPVKGKLPDATVVVVVGSVLPCVATVVDVVVVEPAAVMVVVDVGGNVEVSSATDVDVSGTVVVVVGASVVVVVGASVVVVVGASVVVVVGASVVVVVGASVVVVVGASVVVVVGASVVVVVGASVVVVVGACVVDVVVVGAQPELRLTVVVAVALTLSAGHVAETESVTVPVLPPGIVVVPVVEPLGPTVLL